MTWASLTVRIGGLALLLPIVVSSLTTAEVLVWQLLSSITMLVNLTDFGFSPTFSRIIAYARGGGDFAELKAGGAGNASSAVRETGKALAVPTVVATQSVVYKLLIAAAMVVALIVGGAALLGPASKLPNPEQGWIAWAFSAAASLMVLINGSYVSVLTGFDRIATTRRLDAVVGTLQLGSTCLVALCGGGLVAIVACYSFWTVPLCLLNRFNVAKLNIDGGLPRPRFDHALFSVVWSSAWRSGVGIVMSAGIIQASGLIYAQIAPAADAAAYLLLLRGITAVSQVAQAPFYTKLPAMARLRAGGRLPELAEMAIRGMAVAHWTFVAGAVSLIVAGPVMLHMIGSSVELPPRDISTVLVLAFFVERYCAMHIQAYSLTHHIIWHVMNGVTGALMILFAFALHPLMGQAALPTAMLIGYSAYFAWRGSSLSLMSMGVSRWRFEVRTSVGPAIALVLAIIMVFALHSHLE